tara:strand:+ start:2224 stop:2469 length:246 start_codon:yes stop_codon:yes gene_type:complete
MPIIETIFAVTTLASICTGNVPGTVLGCIGLTATGPVAGGAFAACQSCQGTIQAGSCLSNIQSCGMTTANVVRGIAICPCL